MISYIPEQFPVVLIDRRLADCPLDMVHVSDTTAITSGMTRLIRYADNIARSSASNLCDIYIDC